MSGADSAGAQAGGNNASEFVRKLFRMLEDPSHQDVARWGKDGDTFVVVEGEKFTRSILPKHFKHSNMSSFIRQLNKYDFHKVKPSSDTETTSPNGNVLEFKHPYFRVDSKDDLDNIRRKAPAPRKPQLPEDYTTNQHIGAISEQLSATQQQVQQLQEQFAEMSQTNRVLVNEVMTLQKMLNAQKQAQHEMLNYLTPIDGQHTHVPEQPAIAPGSVVSADDADETSPELLRARELLSSVSANSIADRELERLHGVYGSPADSGSMITPTTMPLLHDPMSDIARYPVYPVGQTVGIDPFHSDNINKIPYAMPSDLSSGGMAEQHHQQPQQHQQQMNITHGQSSAASAEKSTSLWGSKRPRVFLVEDDGVCSKIGVKFLKSMGCDVESASDGVEAYNRVADGSQESFDMIFMDIIMPRLDGVSASLYIRQHCPSAAIVAMTSNIRPEEVQSYFDHGMSGVLAKPFTREGMLKSVRTHMAHLLKNPPQLDSTNDTPGYFVHTTPYLSTSGNTLKFEGTASPGGSNWSSLGGGMDQSYAMMNGSNQFNLTPGGSRSNYQNKMESPGSRGMDQDSPPEKRQRLNPSSGGY